jgi:DNA-binding MarR family transcriptional regulator
MPKSDAIAPSDKRVIQTLLWALKPLDNLTPRSIPLPYAITFLTVALDEGKPIGAYARDLDFDRFVMTRYIQCIGDKGRHGKPGLGLVTVERTPTTPVRTEVFLTKKGRAIAEQVFGNLRRLTEPRA